MIADIGIFEGGDGGDLIIANNDIWLTRGIYQSVFLSLFGGNIESDVEYWGNSLFHVTNPGKRFISETERTLNNVALNSAGRIEIINAVENDLEYLNDFDLNVSVIIDFNTVAIIIEFTGKDSLSDGVFKILWDASKKEVITNRRI